MSEKQELSLATLTAGLVFLGTPFRGTQVATAPFLLASTENFLFDTQDTGILGELLQDSSALLDLLHHFSQWLLYSGTPTCCFFELLKTDYGKLFRVSRMVSTAILSGLHHRSWT